MKRIQISHNVVDMNLLKEVKWYMISSWQKVALSVTGVISLILGIINMSSQQLLQGAILLALGALCIGEIFFLVHSRYKEMSKLIREACEDQQVTYTMSFGKDGVVVHNCQTAIDTKIPYAHIKSMAETKNAYVLSAKNKELIIIRKDCLKMGVQELIGFLKDKDTKIKRWVKES